MVTLIGNGDQALAVHLNAGRPGKSANLVTGSSTKHDAITANPETNARKVAGLKFAVAPVCNDDALMIEEGKIEYISAPMQAPRVKETIAEMNTLYQMDLDEDLAWFAFAYYYKVLQKKGGVSILTTRDGIKEFLLELTRSLPQDEQSYALSYALSDAEPEPIEKLHLVGAIAESF